MMPDRMKNYVDTMSDDDVLILGIPEEEETTKGIISPPPKKKRNIWAICSIALMGVIGIISIGLFCVHRPMGNNNSRDNYVLSDSVHTENSKDIILENCGFSYVATKDTIIGKTALKLFWPMGGSIKLHVGELPKNNLSIILAARAADYRADNGEIVGAFVQEGELRARGNSKLGFCAVIGNEVILGMSKETPFFERAVERSGYFFRQYALVHDGAQGEQTPKGQSIRRALCYSGEGLFIAESRERISYHDFSEALIRMGVQEAIALVGSKEMALYEDVYGTRHVADLPHDKGMTESYIVWVKDL